MEKDKNKLNMNIVIVSIGILFIIPIAGMFFGFILTYCGYPKDRLINLYMFDLDSLKDFYSFWITLFGVPAIGYNMFLNQKRVVNQDNQISIQKNEQRGNRFTKGIELLGSEDESIRVGGAMILYLIAKEFRSEYSHVICVILSSHIQKKTTESEYQENNREKPSTEIQRILNYLFIKDSENPQIADGFHIDIQNSYLRGCVLEGANLERANLRGADLRGANLEGANLERVNLEHADLESASLQGANLVGARLERANLQGANLERANLKGARLQGANLQGANLVGARLERANLERVNLRHANLEHADLEDADLEDAYLGDANLERAYLGDANLERANLEDANLEGANLTQSKLKNAMFTNSNLDKANFTNSIDADISNCKSKINIIM